MWGALETIRRGFARNIQRQELIGRVLWASAIVQYVLFLFFHDYTTNSRVRQSILFPVNLFKLLQQCSE